VSLFRRRRSAEDAAATQSPAPPEATEPEATDPDPADPGAADATAREAARARSGPFDSSEESGDVQRVDLGALRVPARPGMELRLELEDQTQRVIAATIGLEGSTVQIQVFAAPRTQGIWDEIRPEIAAQVTRQGGSADELPGSFGRELLARLPVRTPDGRTAHRPTRFVGVDGPRWFLRAVFSGPAASDDQAAQTLEEMVRGVVVVRGREAMAPRDLLPLTLPAQEHRGEAPGAQGAGDGAPAEAGPERPPLAPLERGPEITERR
jgi:hypothetical protein